MGQTCRPAGRVGGGEAESCGGGGTGQAEVRRRRCWEGRGREQGRAGGEKTGGWGGGGAGGGPGTGRLRLQPSVKPGSDGVWKGRGQGLSGESGVAGLPSLPRSRAGLGPGG